MYNYCEIKSTSLYETYKVPVVDDSILSVRKETQARMLSLSSAEAESAWRKRLTRRFCSDSVDAKLACPMASGEDGDLLRFSARRATGARSSTEAEITSAV